jgi:hypothetical protein
MSHHSGDKTVTIPRDVLIRALTKARILYIAVANQNGHDAGPDDECWAEFEALASYVGTTAELIAEEEER